MMIIQEEIHYTLENFLTRHREITDILEAWVETHENWVYEVKLSLGPTGGPHKIETYAEKHFKDN